MEPARRMSRGLELVRQYVWSAVRVPRIKQSFDSIEFFCLFVGYPRSGHTLVGSILDAHRHVVIGLELDALRYIKFGFRRDQLFYLLIENSRLHARNGRQWTGYSYQVPNQWQGRAERIKVIGDKRGGDSTRRLAKDFTLLDRLRQRIQMPVKIVHVVRNPFDNITTMALRGNAPTLSSAIEEYLSMVSVVERVRQVTSPSDFITVHHERLIAQPQTGISRLCRFLGVDAPASYLADCSAIIFDSPHRTRSGIVWTTSEIKRVSSACLEHDFLAHYTFSDELTTPQPE